MNWYQNPYFGKTAEKKRYEIVQTLEEGSTPCFIQLITIPPTKENQLEIVSAADYRSWTVHRGEPMIVGVACGRREAKQLAVQIVGDVYRLTGTAEIRTYFEKAV